MINKRSLILIGILMLSQTMLGCRTIRKLFAKGGYEFVVQMRTQRENKGELFKHAAERMENTARFTSSLIEVERIPDSDDQVLVKVYGKEEIQQIKEALFTNYLIEFRKIVSKPYPASPERFQTLETASKALSDQQEVLPFSEYSDQYFVIAEILPVLNGEDVRTATAVETSRERYGINCSFKPDGASKLSDWSVKNINSHLGIVLNGTVISIPYVRTQILDEVVIDGRFTKAMANNIAVSLQGGTIPVTYSILSEKEF